MSYPSTQLKAKWDKILKDEGLEDIEDSNGNLKSWHSFKFYTSQFSSTNGTKVQDKLIVNEAKQEYYRLAEQFLYSHKFKNKLEKSIWALHAEGLSYRDIAKALRPKVKLELNKDNINAIVKRLVPLMLEQAEIECND